jgi:hypothetical protein
MGVSVVWQTPGEEGGKAQLVEWGAHVRWSKIAHQVYPRAFKKAVFSFLCIAKKQFPEVPKDVLLLIIDRLAEHYNATPFNEIVHPNPKSLIPEKNEGSRSRSRSRSPGF